MQAIMINLVQEIVVSISICVCSEACMKYLSLLTWVTQLGFSILFPTCAMLLLAYWLQNRFGLGLWIMVLLGVIGVFTSISTTKG